MLIQKIQGTKEKEQGIYYEFDVHSKPIGVGGMGKVYLGYRIIEESGKKTSVAIKAMYEDLPEHVIERAKRESSIQIKHENLVEMLGFVEKDDLNSTGGNVKHYHVISEYINGVSLSDFLCGMTKNQYGVEVDCAKKMYDEYQNDRLKVSLKIIGQVLSAIMTLHDNGYIHRDIDPSNIMITAKGKIKLIDFGIAKTLSSLGSQDKMLTAAGVFIGKAHYAAPELVTGDVKHQDVTTDIYSVGVLFYQLLVGNLPFDGPIPEILEAQMRRKIPIKNVDNKECRAIIKKATEKKQIDRYHSAAEFRVAIDGVRLEEGGNKKRVMSIVLSLIAAIILLVVIIEDKYNSNQHDHKENNDTIVGKELSPVDTIQSVIITEKTSINLDIKKAYELGDYDYEKLLSIAKTYYSRRNIEHYYVEQGKKVINSAYGKKLLETCNNNTNYSNVKVAFILYAELRKISIKDNNKALLSECDIYLDEIKRTSTLYINK